MRKNFIITCCLLILFVAFYNGLKVEKYIIEADEISQAVRIILVTDLHSCIYGKGQKDLIKKIEKQNPDIILMSGDIADDVMPYKGTYEFLEKINKYPCYYVSGNHEFWSGEIDFIKAMFSEYGVKVLEGTNEAVLIKCQNINICGVDDPEAGTDAFNKQIITAFEGIDKNNYTILLSHRPEPVKIYERLDSDLILSGHAHGGQWRIPFILNGLIAPNQGLFPKYAGGKYFLNDKYMVVSRGLSRESSLIPRIFNPPEIVVIDLV